MESENVVKADTLGIVKEFSIKLSDLFRHTEQRLQMMGKINSLIIANNMFTSQSGITFIISNRVQKELLTVFCMAVCVSVG